MKKYKTYIFNKNASQYSLYVNTERGGQFVTFASIGYGSIYSSGFPQYSTDDELIQAGIENSNAFLSGKIRLFNETAVDAPSEIGANDNLEQEDFKEDYDARSYDQVTKFREAQDILTSPPYNVPRSSKDITSKERILQKAADLGISFPNLS